MKNKWIWIGIALAIFVVVIFYGVDKMMCDATLRLNEQRTYSATEGYDDMAVDGINTIPSDMFL